MAVMSVLAYAKHRGVHHKAVQDAISRGTITRRPDGKIDSNVADDQWARNTHPAGGGQAEAGAGNYASFRTAREAYKAKSEKLLYEKEVGRLVDREQVKREVATRAALERDALLTLPARMAHMVAGELGVTTKKAREVLTKVVRAHLEERSKTGEDKAA